MTGQEACYSVYSALIKNKIKFSSYIKELRVEICSCKVIYEEMHKYFSIYEVRRLLVIYDIATAPLCEENFYQCVRNTETFHEEKKKVTCHLRLKEYIKICRPR
jgi:hypothetical protein